MALTDPYATVSEYRAELKLDDTTADLEINLDLIGVSRYIENRVGGRYFNQETRAKSYYGSGSRLLPIDDLVSVTQVASDDNNDGTAEVLWAQTTDYQLVPLNAPAGPEPTPYSGLFIPLWSSKVFPAYTLVTVTGTWGFPSVPIPIKRACIQLTAILRMEGPRASRSLTPEGQILDPNPQAQNIIRDLYNSYSQVSL